MEGDSRRKNMKIIFMGFQTWGYVVLDALLRSGHEVSLVFTHPASEHRYESLWNDSVRELALKHGLPVIECQRAEGEAIMKRVSEVDADIFLLSNWRTWLSPTVYGLARYGGINIHDALLPKYGGFSPINWAIANGEVETGVTVHFLEEELDAGDLLLQERVAIAFTETATDIFKRTLPLFPSLALRALEMIESRRAHPVRQDRSQATFFHKRSERESLIDWSKTNVDVYNLVRAQSDPYPSAFTHHRGERLEIIKVSLPGRVYCGTPGRIFCRTASGVVVLCGRHPANSNQGIVVETVRSRGETIPGLNYFERMGEYLGD